MGTIASPSCTALLTPLRALATWLRSAAGPSGALAGTAGAAAAAAENSVASTTGQDGLAATARPRPPEPATQRPLRGNWPFTVNPPSARPVPGPASAPPQAAPWTAVPSQARSATTVRSRWPKGNAAGKGSAPDGTLRVVRRGPHGTGAQGRLVIAGRMADVCAELDRMVALEAALQTS
ncbi:hypothetical protein [Acidovorax sp. M2(2025)]|uniref:hypothetical protein n=1 Tax=Acidovorax sp. M2(2025) TaxID=3411355 RepID=UPI003BF5C908